ncbi:MAG: A/G-specific adenine glycosylase [Bacteroides sp.]|nr:A/G-specific adenine glycosylase [Bacteroides sp.]
MKFGGIVHAWYEKNRRDLPWRRTKDPYLVWMSEVILQQTRVVQGLDYYNKFAEAFPDLTSLAAASEDQVLKLWQGLGYYSRARNMHHAAKTLVEANEGKMPGNFEGLLAMKGVGIYTASAVASICFGEQKAVVDGNVSRVIARLYGVEEAINSTSGEKIIKGLAEELMEQSRAVSPGTHNQAMMEFGALQCVPVSPKCDDCPLAQGCNAKLTGRVDVLPLKKPKRPPVERWMYFYIVKGGNETILTRREEKGIWRSLYHFPMLESSKEHSEEEILGELFRQMMAELSNSVEEALPEGFPAFSALSEPIRHQLTHLTIHARFVQVNLPALPSLLSEKFIRIAIGELDLYPVPRLIERYMEVAKF